MPKLNNKKHSKLLSIGELSKQVNVEQHVIRYWEKTIKNFKPYSIVRERRYYSEKEVSQCYKIKDLIEEGIYTNKGISHQLALSSDRQKGILENAEVINHDLSLKEELIGIRNEIADLINNLNIKIR